MFKACMIGGLLTVAGAGMALEARAADMPSLFPMATEEDVLPPQRYEFGTGWYLRGDLSASYDDEIAYSRSYLGTLASPTPFPAQAFVAGGGDVLTTRNDWGYGVGGGFGYRFNTWFRADLTGDYLSSQRFNANAAAADGTFSSAGRGTISRWDGLANGYIDLGTWGGLQPYIGAGVGVASLKPSGSVDVATLGATTTYGLSRNAQYNLAWAAMAGVGYQIAPHMLLDIGYRYLDMGSFTVPILGEKKDMASHQARVGLRYDID